MLDIYFSDLTPEAQKRFLAFYNLSNAAEGNYDVFPIISIPDADMGREGVQSENAADTAKAFQFPEEPIELSDAHIERLDEIDNAVYDCLRVILQKTEDEYPWSMKDIGEVTDSIVAYLVQNGHRIYRPAIVTEPDGQQYIEEWEGAQDERDEA